MAEKPPAAAKKTDGLETFVVGPGLPIVDAVTRESVRTGGTVRLDPTKTNLAPLLETGHIVRKG